MIVSEWPQYFKFVMLIKGKAIKQNSIKKTPKPLSPPPLSFPHIFLMITLSSIDSSFNPSTSDNRL